MDGQRKYWFWAWLIQISVAKEDVVDTTAPCEVWSNLVIIHATDETAAYNRAIEIGKTYEGDSRGTLTLNGKPAVAKFLGVQAMGVIHDDLEDGAEITFDIKRSSQGEAQALIADRTTLLPKVKEELRYKVIASE
jgi:hypothetical protein